MIRKPECRVTTRRVIDTPLHLPEKATGSKYNPARALTPHEQLERPSDFHASMKTRPDSPVQTPQKPPRLMSGNEEEPRGSRLKMRRGPIHPCSDSRGIPRCSLQLERSDFTGGNTSGGPRSPCNSRGTLSFPPLVKNTKFSPPR